MKKLRKEFAEIYRRQAAMYMHEAEPAKPIAEMTTDEWDQHVRDRQSAMKAAVLEDLNEQPPESQQSYGDAAAALPDLLEQVIQKCREEKTKLEQLKQ